jgi:hypothetical protein
MGITKGHKIVAIANITQDKKFSSGEETGWRRENLNQLIQK